MNRILLSAIITVLLLPTAARAATPAAGVAQEIRRGFFADVNLGGFFTVGGKNAEGSTIASNAQPYLQLGVGYDLDQTGVELLRAFSVGVNFGLGASAAACFGNVDRRGGCVGDDGQDLSSNFTATMFAAQLSYKIFLDERLTLQPRLGGGLALFDPEPVRDAEGRALKRGAILGLGLGIEYATRMDHFSIGADVDARLIAGPNIFAMAIYPKIKYTF
jgi:hypothetical protein